MESLSTLWKQQIFQMLQALNADHCTWQVMLNVFKITKNARESIDCSVRKLPWDNLEIDTGP